MSVIDGHVKLEFCDKCNTNIDWCLLPKGDNTGLYIFLSANGVEKDRVNFKKSHLSKNGNKLYCKSCGNHYPDEYEVNVLDGKYIITNSVSTSL